MILGILLAPIVTIIPLILRYLIIRRPISTKLAILILIIQGAILLFGLNFALIAFGYNSPSAVGIAVAVGSTISKMILTD